MTLSTITIQLPEDIYQRLQQVAQAMQRPLEDIIFQTIQGNLPPFADDLPLDLQDELLPLQEASDETLWAIVKEVLPSEQWQRHQALLQKNETGSLANDEQDELIELRKGVDRFVFRRSYAFALLKWRGYSLLPMPNVLPPHDITSS